MIFKKKIGAFTVFIKDNNSIYEKALDDFLSGRMNILKLLRSEDETKVWLIDTEKGPMVLKLFVPKHKKFERILKSLIKKDYYQSLIYKTDNAVNHGATMINDIYLLAQRKICNYAYIHIILMEYIDGTQIINLEPISDELKSEIKTVLEQLHTYDMVSGAPHKENTMITKDGVKFIDLSGKRCTCVSRAKDRMELERYLGIKNLKKDWGYYVYISIKNTRKSIKNIRKKLGLRRR
ncbi:lipopolysaccharide core heptose(II) kinase RfaY [Frischella perrara]|uniref:lipopolysaccharide core heptose(II) kinase RfaY n=1 Tax=Frischella perrara TaxID=1267021 RepID=UPI0023F0A9D4|nr:lipopolysaccharide core heptose(II) kinase RfaY [Frischella perrara]MCT6874742.1 lipopolysaccharide core heptose(II) kinase RfaY [Frischella perrara]